MSTTRRTGFHSFICFAVLMAGVASCRGTDQHGADQTAASAADTRTTQPGSRAQMAGDPCNWLPRVDVERILGQLSADPARVSDTEQFDQPDPEGSACRYQMVSHTDDVAALVAVTVLLDGATVLETGLGATFSMTGLSALGGSEADTTSNARWDWQKTLPGGALYAARQGHIAILMSVRALFLPGERIDSLAAAIIDRIPDLPFSDGSVAAEESGPDPCALLTRAEAEAVLGKLIVAPYRARESTALASGAGNSCTYYTAGHHVLVLTPTREGGNEAFKMMAGISRNVTGSLGLTAVLDTLEGPWDQTTRSMDGALYFLKGDQMLELQYRTSSTDLGGALRLAAAAVARM